MHTEILVFVSQYLLILLLGLQSLNVRDGRVFLAAITSLLLGITGFYVTAQIAIVKEALTSVWWFYIFAGPLGIMTSIKLHPKLIKWLHKEENYEE